MIFMRCFHVMHTDAGGENMYSSTEFRRLKYLHSDSGGCLIQELTATVNTLFLG
jgi:hypothetical protein